MKTTCFILVICGFLCSTQLFAKRMDPFEQQKFSNVLQQRTESWLKPASQDDSSGNLRDGFTGGETSDGTNTFGDPPTPLPDSLFYLIALSMIYLTWKREKNS